MELCCLAAVTAHDVMLYSLTHSQVAVLTEEWASKWKDIHHIIQVCTGRLSHEKTHDLC